MPPKILLVDDHPVVLRMVKEEFEARGFDVSTASSAHEAFDMLGRTSWDVVVTDMRMESPASGFDVVRAAKAQAYKPLVVILSAYPIPGSDWQNAGADAMFTKNGNILQMFAEVERLMRERAA